MKNRIHAVIACGFFATAACVAAAEPARDYFNDEAFRREYRDAAIGIACRKKACVERQTSRCCAKILYKDVCIRHYLFRSEQINIDTGIVVVFRAFVHVTRHNGGRVIAAYGWAEAYGRPLLVVATGRMGL